MVVADPDEAAVLRASMQALVEEWANEADYGEDQRYGRIIARTLRSCADQLHERLGGCCTACKGSGHSYEGLCWDCRGTGHPHPSANEVGSNG
jgi:hypothetical protein